MNRSKLQQKIPAEGKNALKDKKGLLQGRKGSLKWVKACHFLMYDLIEWHKICDNCDSLTEWPQPPVDQYSTSSSGELLELLPQAKTAM